MLKEYYPITLRFCSKNYAYLTFIYIELIMHVIQYYTGVPKHNPDVDTMFNVS
jgi:hypothetical protein